MHFVVDLRQKHRGRLRAVGLGIGLRKDRLQRRRGLTAGEFVVGRRVCAENACRGRRRHERGRPVARKLVSERLDGAGEQGSVPGDGETAQRSLAANAGGCNRTLGAVEGRRCESEKAACSLRLQVPTSRIGPRLLALRLGVGWVQSIATKRRRRGRRGSRLGDGLQGRVRRDGGSRRR